MKILIIGATHGNELLGVKLYGRLLQKRSPLLEHIDFIIGNPRAYAARKRYTDFDLNRSYHTRKKGYEAERAREIRGHIKRTKPDIVLDMHTTTCIQPNCLIIPDLEGDTKRRFLRASHINTLFQVQSMGDIASVADNVIGYEVPNKNISTKLLDSIIKDLERFIKGTTKPKTKKLFKMTDKIYKKDVSDDQVNSFVNFRVHELGFVPIMTGENSYKKQTDYLGFKSSTPEEIEV